MNDICILYLFLYIAGAIGSLLLYQYIKIRKILKDSSHHLFICSKLLKTLEDEGIDVQSYYEETLKSLKGGE